MTTPANTHLERICLAGGCFWCTEAVFARVRGVHQVTSGYANGLVAEPSYAQVCQGTTGHAECVAVVFEPAVLALEQLLHIFFATHDPTTLNRQGHDVGTQYRSAIFTTSAAQLAAVQAFVQRLGSSGEAGAPTAKKIVTQIEPLAHFWPAEADHQDYFERYPHQPYCSLVVAPKLDKLQTQFDNWLK